MESSGGKCHQACNSSCRYQCQLLRPMMLLLKYTQQGSTLWTQWWAEAMAKNCLQDWEWTSTLSFLVSENTLMTWQVEGKEGAGTITQVGSRVWDWKVGDEVYFTPDILKPNGGSFAEFCSVPQFYLARKPESISLEESMRIKEEKERRTRKKGGDLQVNAFLMFRCWDSLSFTDCLEMHRTCQTRDKRLHFRCRRQCGLVRTECAQEHQKL